MKLIKPTFQNHEYLNIFLACLWIFWVLSPLLDTGFISDDAYNSQIKGTLILDNVSLLNRIWDTTISWLNGAGRFNPIGWGYTYSLYYFITNTHVIKVLNIIVIILSLLSYVRFISIFNKNKLLQILILLIFPLLIQFRIFHDPVLAFTFLIPLISTVCFASLIFYNNYLIYNNKYYYISAIILFTIALLIYEVSYFFVPLYLIVFWKSSKHKNHILGLILFFALVISHYAFSQLLASPGKPAYPGLNLHLDFILIFKALFYQVFSSMPTSWKFENNYSHQNIFFFQGYQTVVFIIFSIIISRLFYTWKDKIKYLNYLLIIILNLIILISIPVVVTGHQKEIVEAGLGYGYLVVYIQYFGVVLSILIIINYLLCKCGSLRFPRFLIATFFGFGIGFIGLVTFNENVHIAKLLDFPYKTPREFLAKVIQAGILDEVSEGDLVLREYRIPADNGWFLTLSTNRKIHTCAVNVPQEYPNCISQHLKKNPSAKIFTLHYSILDDGDSFAIISEIDKNQLNDGEQFTSNFKLISNSYRLFINGELSNSINASLDFNKMKSFPLKATNGKFNINNFLTDKFYSSFAKFLEPESDGINVLRWSSGFGDIFIENNSKDKVNVIVRGILLRPDVDRIDVAVFFNGVKITSLQVTNRIDFSSAITLRPGINKLSFTSNAKPISNGDPRNIVFGFANYSISEGIR